MYKDRAYMMQATSEFPGLSRIVERAARTQFACGAEGYEPSSGQYSDSGFASLMSGDNDRPMTFCGGEPRSSSTMSNGSCSEPNSLDEAYLVDVGGSLTVVHGREGLVSDGAPHSASTPWPADGASGMAALNARAPPPPGLPPAGPPGLSGAVLSIGSVGHEEGKCWPCKFHNLNNTPCWKGANCDRCHDPSHALLGKRVRRGVAKKRQGENATAGPPAAPPPAATTAARATTTRNDQVTVEVRYVNGVRQQLFSL